MASYDEYFKPGAKYISTKGMTELHLPDKERAAKLMKMLEIFEWTTIQDACIPLLKYFAPLNLFVNDGGVHRRISDRLNSIIHKKTKLSPVEAKILLTTVISDWDNVAAFFKSQPGKVRRVMTESVERIWLSEKRVKEILGHSGISGRRIKYPKLAPELMSFTTTSLPEAESGEGRQGQYAFSLNPILRRPLLSVILTDVLRETNLEQLPEGEQLKTFSGEGGISTLIALMENAYKKGTLAVNKSDGRVSVTKMKAMLKKISISEFFSSSPVETDLSTRGRLLINGFIQFLEFGNRNVYDKSDNDMRLKLLFNSGLVNETAMFSVLLEHLKHLLPVPYRCALCERQAENIRIALRTCNGEWMRVEKVLAQSRILTATDMPCTLFDEFSWEALLFQNVRTSEIVCAENAFTQVTVPFTQAYIFLLAAFGFVEVAYRDPELGDVSCFSGLRYVRLTSMGSFAAGLDEKYKLAEPLEQRFFEADTDNLIVRSLQPGSIYETLLEDVAESIGSSRFRVTPASFLKRCRTAQNVKDSILAFRQLVRPDTSGAWGDFFRSLEAGTALVSRHSNDEYVIWRINPDDRELLEIVSADPVIRKYTRKAEGFTLLVEKRRTADVKERLKVYGYLTE